MAKSAVKAARATGSAARGAGECDGRRREPRGRGRPRRGGGGGARAARDGREPAGGGGARSRSSGRRRSASRIHRTTTARVSGAPPRGREGARSTARAGAAGRELQREHDKHGRSAVRAAARATRRATRQLAAGIRYRISRVLRGAEPQRDCRGATRDDDRLNVSSLGYGYNLNQLSIHDTVSLTVYTVRSYRMQDGPRQHKEQTGLSVCA